MPSPYTTRYASLNSAQRRAVDIIEGPVMVIAGPGTGKTEVLSMRIASLLQSEAQVQPHDILCLTYTDEAANSMRRRLVTIIGPAAHRVTICTFHGFCNGIIQANPDYFGQRSLAPVSDLEKADIMRALVDDIPEGNPLRRYGQDPYYDIRRLRQMFDYMKSESQSPKDISDAIDAYIQSLPERKEYQYANNTKFGKKGELKQALYDAELKRMEATRAAAYLYEDYSRRMAAAGRYDYADMILWVIEAFKNHPDLLQRSQERYQFVLVDEFQDTNGAQLNIVNALTDYWDAPNIFVVGDDDQSIYEFQGARIRNIIDFYERYQDSVEIVVLPHNYRSSQSILDKAASTIRNNTQRLINQLSHLGLTKDIIASNDRFRDGADTVPTQVLEFANPLQEEAWIAYQIEELLDRGLDLSCVSVLYAQHKQASGLMRILERKGIPFCAKKQGNVLDLPLVQTILNTLRYLNAEKHKAFSGEYLLFEIMHAPVFGMPASDIATLALYLQSPAARSNVHLYYRQLIEHPLLLETIGISQPAAFIRFGKAINSWLELHATAPLTLLVEMIMYESGMVSHLLRGKEPIWDIQALHTFFSFVKETCTATPRTGIAELMAIIERLDEEGIGIPFEKVFQDEKGVRFFTAHGAKGSEYEYVFLLGANKQYWEAKPGSRGFKLPDNLVNTEDAPPQSNDEEVARRLFYVALTRAKKHLFVSYALESNEGKKLDNSLFVDEISTPQERLRPKFETPALMAHLEWALQPVPPVQIAIGQRKWIDRILSQLALSPSTLTQYLRCPLSFYYTCLLRVPMQDASFFSFGSAIHHALEVAFTDMRKASGTWPDKQRVVDAFERALYAERESMLPQEFQRRLEQGRQLVSSYYDERLQSQHKEVETELKVPRFMLDDAIPITGRIDKIEKYPDGSVIVVDYKTGKPVNAQKKIHPPTEDEPLGGDYWRQMVFYKILLENHPDRRFPVRHGVFDLVEKNDKGTYEPKTVPLFPHDVAIVREQIRDAWSRIQNHDFDTGCGEETCHWCNFARQYELIRPLTEAHLSEIDDH